MMAEDKKNRLAVCETVLRFKMDSNQRPSD